jgi:uncharacterized membrane protein YgcG
MKKIYFLFILLSFCKLAPAQTPVSDVVEDSAMAAENTEERIMSFHAAIGIDTTGLVKITETIRVYANGSQIRRGIFRSIPVYRKDKSGKKQRIDIEVLSVRKNGAEEDYHTETKGDDFVIYIGNKNLLLDPGAYTYQVTYQSKGHIGFFEGYDELYWNVTGNEWVFPIEQASATLFLPPGAQVKNTACYTGVTGATDHDCDLTYTANGAPVFTTSKSLAAAEGLTVAVSWQAGLVHRPPPPNFFQRLWAYRNIFLALAGLIYLLSFLYTTWKVYGKDAAKPLVVPSFRPPNNWSPAVIRYLYKRSIDDKVFAVSIVNLAVKKLLRIKQDADQKTLFTLEKTGADVQVLAAEEEKAYEQLFCKSESVTVNNKEYKLFGKVRMALADEVKRQVNLKEHYNANTKQLWKGTWRVFAILLAYLLLVETAATLAVFLVLIFWILSLCGCMYGVKSLRISPVAGIFVIIFSLPFLLGTSGLLIALLKGLSVISLVFVVILVTAYVMYVMLIPAHTKKGMEAGAAIEGFRMYLSTAEEHRLNMITPPEHTPELFERLLPYAIALDLENAWGKKFSTILEASGYSPDWYTGDVISYGVLAGSMPRQLNSSLGSAQQNPQRASSGSSGSSGSSSWSSGSSGSGSSGGGGGGGGGGGW